MRALRLASDSDFRWATDTRIHITPATTRTDITGRIHIMVTSGQPFTGQTATEFTTGIIVIIGTGIKPESVLFSDRRVETLAGHFFGAADVAGAELDEVDDAVS